MNDKNQKINSNKKVDVFSNESSLKKLLHNIDIVMERDTHKIKKGITRASSWDAQGWS